jgi:hypothetical protein
VASHCENVALVCNLFLWPLLQPPFALESRDHFFSRLIGQIEAIYARNKYELLFYVTDTSLLCIWNQKACAFFF